MLFTTFTRNLATDIRSNLTKICTPEELQRIEVQHLDGWVLQFLKGQGLPVRVFDDNGRKACWDMALAMEDTSLAWTAASTKKSGKTWCSPTAAPHNATTWLLGVWAEANV